MSVVGTWTGQQARDLRNAFRMSLVTFAAHLGVSERTVSNWEASLDKAPSLLNQQVLDVALDRAPVDVQERFALYACQPRDAQTVNVLPTADLIASHTFDPNGDDDMNRRELLRLLTIAGPLVAMSPGTGLLDWERLESARGTQAVEAATLEEYAKLNAWLWRVFALPKPKVTTLPLVRQQLHVLTESLQQPHTEDAHRRLCALTCDLFQLAGEIFFDCNRYGDAAQCYTTAAMAGREANAYDLWSCALVRHAFVGVYERRFEQTVPMLNLAVGLARKGDGVLSTRHWASTVRAQALAGVGDLDGCRRALDTAEEVRDLKGQVHNGGWLRFDGSRLAEERGTCYVELRRPDLAETVLSDALSQDLTLRRKGGVLTDLAMIGVQRHDPDRVLAYANAAMDTARQAESGVIGRKLQGLQANLGALASDGRIRNLSEQITDLTKNSAKA